MRMSKCCASISGDNLSVKVEDTAFSMGYPASKAKKIPRIHSWSCQWFARLLWQSRFTSWHLRFLLWDADALLWQAGKDLLMKVEGTGSQHSLEHSALTWDLEGDLASCIALSHLYLQLGPEEAGRHLPEELCLFLGEAESGGCGSWRG